MYYNKIDKYKKYIIHEKRWNVFLVILGVFLIALILWGAFYSPLTIVFAVFPLSSTFLGIKGIIGNNRLLNKLSSIEKDQVINKTDERKLSYAKVVFLGKTEYHGRVYHPKFYGIKIVDSQKNKYYYFFDDYFEYDKKAIDKIRAKFISKICIQCYKGTSIIRTVENDPYFLRFKLGKYYDN